MVEITLPIVLQIIQTASLVVGIIYYLTIMRNSQRNQELTLKAQEQAVETRQAQLLMNLVNTVRSTEWRRQWHTLESLEWTDYQDFREKYGNDVEIVSTWTSIIRFYECVGVIVKNNLIDLNLIHSLLGTGIKWVWNRYEPLILGDRERFQSHGTIWSNMEYLYNEIIRFEEQLTS